jgi:hypothetical protein
MLGYSFVKSKPFDPSTSDLDIAILNPILFIEMLEAAHSSTRGFSDLRGFSRTAAGSAFDLLSDGIVRHGMIYLNFMPNSPLVSQLRNGLNFIAKRHSALFGDLTCAVYASENLFIEKQQKIIEIAGREL